MAHVTYEQRAGSEGFSPANASPRLQGSHLPVIEGYVALSGAHIESQFEGILRKEI